MTTSQGRGCDHDFDTGPEDQPRPGTAIPGVLRTRIMPFHSSFASPSATRLRVIDQGNLRTDWTNLRLMPT